VAVEAARALLTRIGGSGQRRLLWLAGDARWTLSAGRDVAAALPTSRIRWLGSRAGRDDPNQRTAGLGGEADLLIVDAWAGLDLDALGAAVGTLRGGGLLLLLTPPAALWPQQPDPAAARCTTFPHTTADVTGRLIRRLCGLLAASPAVQRLDLPAARASHAQARRDEPAMTRNTASGLVPGLDRARSRAGPSRHDSGAPAHADSQSATAEQAAAIDAILATAQGRARRPLVLTADRGRGKSAAMGLAAARLRADGQARILLTAPRRAAAEAVLRHAGEPALRFLAPDALLAARPPADLLLVDEAAAIPAPMLEAMLWHYPRIVFATTVHGYEGTGRGFALRFRAVLERLAPGWRALCLHEPIRWAADDPLEALINRALLLDAEPAADDAVAVALDAGLTPEFETPDRDALAGDEPALRQAFGLLVLGHYQTRPSDLRQLLDAPDIAVHWLHANGLVLAVAVTGREGRLPQDLLQPIFAGRRRPQGHLLPQTLSAHAGLYAAPALAYRRILRIATHPAARRRGLGRRLVAAIAEQALEAGADLLGASFGATPALIRFWRRCGLSPVHVGSRRNAASGAHAAVMLTALTPAGGALLALGRRRLLPRLALSLGGPLRALEPAVVAALLADAPVPAVMQRAALSVHDQQELDAFAHGNRGLDATRPALHRLLLCALPRALSCGGLEPVQCHALIACGLQHAEPGACAAELGLPGEAAVLTLLRGGVGALLRGELLDPVGGPEA
jgi:tRNA(Met) cytidine acetyltransferase